MKIKGPRLVWQALAYILHMSVLLGLEPFHKFVVVGWLWSKGILEFYFGPNLGLGT